MNIRDVFLMNMAKGVNQWLHEMSFKGQDVNNYQIFLDRVVDIKNALENSMDEFENVISSFAEREDIKVYMEDPLTKEEVDLLKVIFRKHIKATRQKSVIERK